MDEDTPRSRVPAPLGSVEPHAGMLKIPPDGQLLFKMITVENLLRSIVGGYLHFNRVDSYLDFPGADPDDGKQLPQDQQGNANSRFEKAPDFSAADYYDKSRGRTYACCFSLDNSEFIWSSYANGSEKGKVCLVFAFSKLRATLNQTLHAGNSALEYNGMRCRQIFNLNYGIVEYVEWDSHNANQPHLPNPLTYTYLKSAKFSKENELRVSLSALGMGEFALNDGSIMKFPSDLQMAFDFRTAIADESIQQILCAPDTDSDFLKDELHKLSIVSKLQNKVHDCMEVTAALREFALRICTTDRKPVGVTDAAEREALAAGLSGGILVEESTGIRFASEALMVQAATQHVLETERDKLLSSPKACFERLDEIFGNEIGKQEMVCGQVLAALHNTGELDAFAWGRQAIEAGVGVFDVLHVLESAIQFLDYAKAEFIFDFFCGHYEKVKNDLAQGMIYRKLDPWLAKHPDVAHEIKRFHEVQPMERSGSLYACALTAIVNHDFATGYDLTLTAAQSPEPLIAGPSQHALGLMDYNDPQRRRALDQTIQLCTRILRTPNHQNLETAVAVLTRLVKFDEPSTVPLLDEAAQTGAPLALYPLSVLLWTEDKTLRDKPWFLPLLMRLTAARAEHGGILRNIDFVLMDWVRDPQRLTHAMDFINAWIANQPAESFKQAGIADAFSSTIRRIAEIPSALNQMLTSWLLSDDQRYPFLASKLISRLRTEGLTSIALDSAMLDSLNEPDIRFLLRRMLGYLSGDEILIRLVFSLAHTRDAKTRTFGFIRSVYRQHVGHDYPHQTIEYLTARSVDDKEVEDVRTLADEIAKTLQGQLDTLNALPVLKEFMPSSEKSKRFAKERRRQMNEAFEEASKDSIWKQLATNIPLKAGRRTFQSIQGRYTDTMELKSMSHSIALPRSEVSDPAGSARERLLMRRAKRDAP